MEDNTPATQAFPQGDPVQDSPIQDTPIERHRPNPDDPNQGVGKPTRPEGPNAAPIVLGLVALALAALIIVTETMDVQVDWSRVGPGAIVGVGALLVVLGAIGLVRRHDGD
jgi:hypothetical protein